MNHVEYWQEAISDSLDEHGVTATPEQIAAIARDMQCCHENYGLAFYQPENPLIGEVSQLKRQLKAEREKIPCKACGGKGSITTYGGTMQATSQCHRCRGEGKHDPERSHIYG